MGRAGSTPAFGTMSPQSSAHHDHGLVEGVCSLDNMLRTTFLRFLVIGGVVSLLVWTASAHAAPIHGFGELKFGMSPADAAALEDCSSQTECLYDLLGKNRYFTLGYDPARGATDLQVGTVPALLSHIDIEMGAYTKEWFLELFEVLASQYAVSHHPTEREDTFFHQARSPELVIGFAEGRVLLKLVRRPFGNIIMRVIYQDAARARVQRQAWNAPAPPAP